MDSQDPTSTEELQARASLARVFADWNKCAATMQLLGQSTILTLSNDRVTGEVYCMPHHLTIDGTKRSLMIAALRYADTYVKQDGVWLYAERCLYVDWIEERPVVTAMKRVVLVGASGMVGGYALRYLLEDAVVGSVT